MFESVRRTLAEVTELKNLMDNVFSSIVSGVITADIEDKITLINRAAEIILGQTSQDWSAYPIWRDAGTTGRNDLPAHLHRPGD